MVVAFVFLLFLVCWLICGECCVLFVDGRMARVVVRCALLCVGCCFFVGVSLFLKTHCVTYVVCW